MKSDDSRKQRATSPRTFNPLVGLDSKSPDAAKAKKTAMPANKSPGSMKSQMLVEKKQQQAKRKSSSEPNTTPRGSRGKSRSPAMVAEFRQSVREQLELDEQDGSGNTGGSSGAAFNAWPLAEISLIPERARTQLQREQFPELVRIWREACDTYSGPDRCMPAYQLAIARRCLRSRQRIVKGDAALMFEEVTKCVRHGLVVPPWLATEFLVNVQSVRYGFVDKWSDSMALGPERPQSMGKARPKADNRSNAVMYGQPLYMACLDILSNCSPKDLPAGASLNWVRKKAAERCGIANRDTRVIAGYIEDFLESAEMYPSLDQLARGLPTGGTFARMVHDGFSPRAVTAMLAAAHGETIAMDLILVDGLLPVADQMAGGRSRLINRSGAAAEKPEVHKSDANLPQPVNGRKR